MLPLVPLLAAGALGFTPQTFHLMKVKEVFAGSEAAPNAQYVMLQMYSFGQNQVGGMQVVVYGPSGTVTNTFTFPAIVPNAADQSTILIATAEAQNFFAPGGPLVADLLMMPVLNRLGGKVCFHDPMFGLGDIDCASWGGYGGAPAGVGVPFNFPVGLERGVAMRRRMDICGLPTILDGCDDTENSSMDFLPQPPAPRTNPGVNGAIPPSACGNGAVQSLEQCDDNNLASGDGCSSQCRREATAFTPQALLVDPGENGVLEPGEQVLMQPTWRNVSTAALPLTGAISLFAGPPGATYQVPDGQAAYGTVMPANNASCGADCYTVGLFNPTSRPATHWDAAAAEVMSSYSFWNWPLHVGVSFPDVPKANPFYRFVETLLHRGVTAGCTATDYCPAAATTREGMSVFVLVAREGAGYNPPACGTPVFNDVPAASPFCRFIEELFRRGVVSGCGNGNYCPSGPVTREAMAVFVLRTLDPALNPPACVAGSEMFGDVPAANGFCRWIEELVRRGVVTGCGGGNYCPSASVTREQMGVFISVTFGLTLYGV
jgi:cysteine-rich repeat protein